MAQVTPVSPRQRVLRLIESTMTHTAWLPGVLAGASTVTSSVLLSTIGDLANGGQILRMWLGIGFALFSLAMVAASEWWRYTSESAGRFEVAQANIALSNAVLPMAQRIAAMPTQDSRTRRRNADRVSGQAASSLQLILRDVKNIRVVIFRFNDARTSLDPAYHVGRADAPHSFVRGDNGRGDAAFNMIQSEEAALFVDDVQSGQTAGWQGSGSGYRTFISAPIRADGRGYGMLTVDAPAPGDLSANDAGIVTVIATLLAIAIAEEERS